MSNYRKLKLVSQIMEMKDPLEVLARDLIGFNHLLIQLRLNRRENNLNEQNNIGEEGKYRKIKK